MSQVVRPYRGISAQQRRAERRARLVDAGLDVAGAEGIAGTTMKAVCARAGLTERYFYESFGDRDELLVAVMDAALREIDEAVASAVAAARADLLERARAAVGALIRVLTEDPRKGRAYIEAVGSEALKERQAAGVRAYADQLARQMSELHGLDAARDHGRLQLAALVLVGGTAQAVAGWLDGTIDLPRDEVADEIARLCVAAADTVRASAA